MSRQSSAIAKSFFRGTVPAPALIMLLMFAAAVLGGGSSRADMMPVLFLQPISAILLVASFWTLRKEHFSQHKFPLLIAALATGWIILTLIPLPPAIWQILPGREPIIQIDEVAGLTGVWRPISMSPSSTYQALFSLFAPLTILICASQLDFRQLKSTLPWMTAILSLTALAAYAQSIGGSWSFYSLSNANSGFVANRNHQALALACLVPMIVTVAALRISQVQPRRSTGSAGRKSRSGTQLPASMLWVLACTAIAALIPLIFIAGSRAGLGLMGAALAAAILLGLFRPKSNQTKSMNGRRSGNLVRYLAGFVVVIGGISMIIAAVFISERDLAFQRLFAKDLASDIRFPIWENTLALIPQYFPFGTGIGSFAPIYQISEPAGQLGAKYINQAHNEYLGLALTGGLPITLLLLVAIAAYLICVFRTARSLSVSWQSSMLRLLGLTIITLCAASSIVDYPLRTPILGCLFVYAVFLARAFAPPHEPREAPSS